MITTDKITAQKGDKVWRIVDNEIEQGTITHTDDNWTQVQWPNENYHKSFESYGHWDDKDGNPTFEVNPHHDSPLCQAD